MKTKTLVLITLIVLPFLYVFTKPASGKSASLGSCINLFKTLLIETVAPGSPSFKKVLGVNLKLKINF